MKTSLPPTPVSLIPRKWPLFSFPANPPELPHMCTHMHTWTDRLILYRRKHTPPAVLQPRFQLKDLEHHFRIVQRNQSHFL